MPAPATPAFESTSRQFRVAAMLGLPAPSVEALGLTEEATGLMKRAAVVYADSIKPETRRSYASRWFDYEGWCRQQRLPAIPATADTVILYLQSLVDGPRHMSISTVRGRLAAISRINVEAGWSSPARDPAMRMYVGALARQLGHGTRQKRVRALTTTALRETVSALPVTDARLVRDRAVLALVDVGVPATVIANLVRSEVVVRKSGLWITSNHLPEGPVRIVDKGEQHAHSAFVTWFAMARSGPEYVFTTTDPNGVRSTRRISAGDIDRTVARRLSGFGLNPADPDALRRAMALLSRPDGFAIRDRALLLVGFAGGMRRVDLATLRWKHVTDDPEGVLIFLPFSKTDRTGKGRTIAIPYGRNPTTCPVASLHAWRQYVAAQTPGDALADTSIFVPIGRSGRLGHTPISTANITRIVIRRTEAAGLTGDWGGRSLRAGLVTSAIEMGVPLEQIAHQTGHRTIESLMLYERRQSPFERNPAGRVGL